MIFSIFSILIQIFPYFTEIRHFFHIFNSSIVFSVFLIVFIKYMYMHDKICWFLFFVFLPYNPVTITTYTYIYLPPALLVMARRELLSPGVWFIRISHHIFERVFTARFITTITMSIKF